MKTTVIIIENVNNQIDIDFLKKAIESNLEFQQTPNKLDEGFMEWADLYFFKDNLNVKIKKHELRDSYVSAVGMKSDKSVQEFRKSLQSYCKLRGWIFNPAEQQREDGRIVIKSHDRNGKRTIEECFYIKTENVKKNKPLEKISFIENLMDEKLRISSNSKTSIIIRKGELYDILKNEFGGIVHSIEGLMSASFKYNCISVEGILPHLEGYHNGCWLFTKNKTFGS